MRYSVIPLPRRGKGGDDEKTENGQAQTGWNRAFERGWTSQRVEWETINEPAWCWTERQALADPCPALSPSGCGRRPRLGSLSRI